MTTQTIKAGTNPLHRHDKNVGTFLDITKKIIFFIHRPRLRGPADRPGPSRGSYVAPAPYLDKYGETDVGSKGSGARLFLSQKRYDKLVRQPWLQHGIPSVVSRKLDAESNPGGWDTL